VSHTPDDATDVESGRAPAAAPIVAAPQNMLYSARLIAICTLVSRVTGLLRDILLAQQFALGWVQDAFTYAFQFPNLFRRLFGEGGLAPAFVPTFTRTLETEGREAAWQLLSRTFALMSAALTLVTILIELALLAAWIFFPGEGELARSRLLLLSLTALMAPFMISICVLALFSSILNCLHRFVVPAIAPIILNVGIIAGLLLIGPALSATRPEIQVYGVAISVLAAGIAQLIFIYPALRSAGVPIAWKWDPGHAAVRNMLRLLPPIALGQGILAFGVFLDAQICVLLTRTPGSAETFSLLGARLAYPLQEGALSTLRYAQTLYQFPLGVLAISLATAALPAFSRLAARDDWPAWAGEVRRTIRFAIFEALLAGACMLAISDWIVRLLFEYRSFDAADTARTASVLWWYGLGLWAFAAQHMVLRAFYSLHDPRTPLMLAAAILPLNVVISLVLVWYPAVSERAFAVASIASSSIGVVAGLLLLQRRVGTRVLDSEFFAAVLRMLIASAASAVLLYAIGSWIRYEEPDALIPRLLLRATAAGAMLLIGAAAYFAISAILGLPEARETLTQLRRRLATGKK
jgi:putative peptidoglycan lipid II flippase